MKALLAVLLMGGFTPVSFGAWTPPERPNPQVILQEAEKDTSEGRYEDALAKHVWFHESVLKVDPAMLGVRLSFALDSFRKLGEVFPPALEKLKEFRDADEKAIRAGTAVFASFQDFAAINRELKQEKLTTQLFEWLDTNEAEDAQKVFEVAERGLSNEQKYTLALKYLDPERDLAQLIRIYKINLAFAGGDEKVGDMAGFARKSFENRATIMIALLVNGDRKPEADVIAAGALKELKTPQFEEEVKKALEGNVPREWP